MNILVVVPAYNEDKSIYGVVKNIMKSELKPDVAVMIVYNSNIM